jgi:hypothetical protein
MVRKIDMIDQEKMSIDLINAEKYLYHPLGWSIEGFSRNSESQEYGAATFEINNKKIIFRVAKITPTKVGQFVAIWKRIKSGPTAPYDEKDIFDIMIIHVRSNHYWGQFIFPKSILVDKGIISHNGKEGKRGIRVYPSWDKTDNPQAEKTQRWQQHYFIDISNEKNIDTLRVKKILDE